MNHAREKKKKQVRKQKININVGLTKMSKQHADKDICQSSKITKPNDKPENYNSPQPTIKTKMNCPNAPQANREFKVVYGVIPQPQF